VEYLAAYVASRITSICPSIDFKNGTGNSSQILLYTLRGTSFISVIEGTHVQKIPRHSLSTIMLLWKGFTRLKMKMKILMEKQMVVL
jgi:hypothetical protein